MKSEHDAGFSKFKHCTLSLPFGVEEMNKLCEFWRIHKQNELTGNILGSALKKKNVSNFVSGNSTVGWGDWRLWVQSRFDYLLFHRRDPPNFL